MCGIFGIIGERPDLKPLASAMARALTHRGPDDEGFHIDGAAMIGNRRLSIIDVRQGHQPILSGDGRIAVVQNGEIYNYVELQNELKTLGVTFRTNSDTEVLLKLYETYGPAFVTRLNGMFAIAIWDGRDRSLHLYRDRLGIKPLFVAESDGLLFASEIKALLAAGVKARTRMEALHHYLSFNYVPPSLTAFEGIEQVQPGWAASYKDGRLMHWQWWKPDFVTDETKSESDWADELRALLADAVRIHLRSDVEVGAFLSGGVDSSTVVALSKAHIGKPMHSFSIGFDEAQYDETRYAEMVARQYGTQHHMERVRPDMVDLWPKVLWHCEQPHGDASFLPTYVLSALAARRVKVVLTGDGGDELLAGYERYIPFMETYGQADHDTFERAYFANQGLIAHDDKLALYRPEWQSRFRSLDSFELMRRDFAEVRGCDPVNRMLWLDMKWLLPGNNLSKPDRTGMAAGLEARVPFLDSRIIEMVLTMSGSMKLRGNVTKYALKQAMERQLPHEILHRPKQMFTVPIGEWFKRHLAETLRDVVLSDRAVARGLFNPDAVRKLTEDHISGRANHTRLLRALMAAEIWSRLFVDGESHEAMPEFQPQDARQTAAAV